MAAIGNPSRRRKSPVVVAATIGMVVVGCCGLATIGFALTRDSVEHITTTVPGRAGTTQDLTTGEQATITTGATTSTVTVRDPVTGTSDVDGSPVVTVVVELACTVGVLDYNPLYFRYRDPGGFEHEYDASFRDGDLTYGSLPAGHQVSGTLSFPADPDTVHGGAIVYTGPTFGQLASWRIP